MKNNYVAPQVEVVEVEIEGAILQTSGGPTVSDVNDGGEGAKASPSAVSNGYF